MQKNYREQLLEKNKPLHQVNDTYSLDWIESNLPKIDVNKDEYNELLRMVLEFKPWDKFNDNYYIDDQVVKCIHGKNHAVRVAINCLILNQIFKYSVNHDDLIYMALFHDCGRLNDNKDEGHGERSSAALGDYIKMGINIKNPAPIMYSISVHEKMYSEIELNYEYSISKEYVDLLKAADALDRYRFPRDDWWINDTYLKLIPNDLSRKIAMDIVVKSERMSLFDSSFSFDEVIRNI